MDATTTAVKDPRTLTKTELRRLFAAADAAGKAAASGTTPEPMVVQQHASMLNDASPVVKEWLVPDGVCGFAWVVIRPGNCRAANYAKAHWNARKDYYGGVSISCHDYNQSMTRKEAYAHAFAGVLRSAGIDARGQSRMD